MVLIGDINVVAFFQNHDSNFSIKTDTKISAFIESIIKMNSIETISSDQKKFTFAFPYNGETSSYNIYINHTDDISDESFVWDYYGSGELYCNFRNYNLSYWKDSFVKLYTQYLILDKLPQPDKAGHNPYPFTSSVLFNGRYVWSFSISTFFNFEKVIKESPVCSYFTINNSDISILSEHYQFANVVDSTPCCSHPTLSSPTKHSFCQFYPGNYTCPLYTPSSKVVSSRLVDFDNTSNQILFDLTYSFSDSSSHIFQIKNLSNDSIINTMRYSSDFSYEEVLSESIEIFDSYISSFSDSNCQISEKELTSQDINKDKPKVSYIESLIGV